MHGMALLASSRYPGESMWVNLTGIRSTWFHLSINVPGLREMGKVPGWKHGTRSTSERNSMNQWNRSKTPVQDHQTQMRKIPNTKRVEENLSETCIFAHTGGLREAIRAAEFLKVTCGFVCPPQPPRSGHFTHWPGQLHFGGVCPCWCILAHCQGKMKQAQEQNANSGSRRKEAC